MLNLFSWPFRWQMLFGAAVSAALIGYAFYVEHGMFMLPCPLCILQRIAFGLIGVVGLLAAIHAPKGRLGRGIYGISAFIFAAMGVGIAWRHLWLQSLPPGEVPACGGMGLEYMIGSFGFIDALARTLAGSADCAKIDWTWLGLSMPGWTLICYVLLGLGALYAGFRRR